MEGRRGRRLRDKGGKCRGGEGDNAEVRGGRRRETEIKGREGRGGRDGGGERGEEGGNGSGTFPSPSVSL